MKILKAIFTIVGIIAESGIIFLINYFVFWSLFINNQSAISLLLRLTIFIFFIVMWIITTIITFLDLRRRSTCQNCKEQK